jgi:hypothetical protein
MSAALKRLERGSRRLVVPIAADELATLVRRSGLGTHTRYETLR